MNFFLNSNNYTFNGHDYTLDYIIGNEMFDNETYNTNSTNFDNLIHFYDEKTFRLSLYQIKEDIQIFPWLKKEKATETIKKNIKMKNVQFALKKLVGIFQ